ncbi:hypothetical protein [Leucobacter chromiireducens]|uniref:hypothetical protein n=1 Tax=Leucobacter chromiireducens TaxID=283877 RepID=UPI000F62F97B|nr:hypothetical protein [Leucobacter chromiireducens]
MIARRPRARVLLGAGLGALLLVSAVGVTSAAYIDHANVNLASGGIGNPVAFSVQVKDTDGNWHEADTPEAAVVYPTTPSAEITFSKPVEFTATMRIAPDAPGGDVTPSLQLRSDCSGPCAALFEGLVFDVLYDGTAVASGVSAAEFNGISDRAFSDVIAGEEHTVTLSAVLDPEIPFMWSGSETVIGLVFEGMTN